MATTDTTTTPASFPFLEEYDSIEFRGMLYTIVKVNPKNYAIEDANGKRFNLARTAPVIPRGKVAPKLTPKLVDVAVFKEGDPVVLAGNGKFGGMKGLVCKVNPAKYHVVVKNVGVISASPAALIADND